MEKEMDKVLSAAQKRPTKNASYRETARRLRRVLSRGVTLVEVLIVVSIMALIAGGATLLVFPQYKKAQVKLAVEGARTLKQAADLYVNLNSSGEGCPSVQDLVSAKNIDGKKVDDPWGVPFRLSCGDGDVRVLSSGPDKKEGTPDDLRDDMSNAEIDKVANQ